MRKSSVFFLILTLVSCSPTGSVIAVRVVSSQAHLVSGGDALIEVIADASSGDELQLTVNGETQMACTSA